MDITITEAELESLLTLEPYRQAPGTLTEPPTPHVLYWYGTRYAAGEESTPQTQEDTHSAR